MPPTPPYLARQDKLTQALQAAGLTAIALNPGPSLVHLTGLHFHLMERPVVVLFTPHAPPVIVLPELETGKLADLPFPVQAFPYGENPQAWADAFQQAALSAKLGAGRVGLEPRQLRVLELRFLEAAAPQAQFVSAEDALAPLRLCKDAGEIAAMRQAVDIAQRALRATLPLVQPGLTERQLAAELTLQLLRAGCDPTMPFTPIVASGPNSANPHATPTGRPLERGDLLIMDWGASCNGYVSDLTRTFAVGDISPEMAHIASIVEDANAAGRSAARPGVTAGEVDYAARQVIEAAGYGQFFTHRTGHGIGMEGHEPPYLFAGNPFPLTPGMTFTVEPGIYLPGRGGVRIEDNLAITESGADCLSDLPRGVIVPGG